MPNSDKQNRPDCNTPDLACTRCRERKIRCDRERPRCANCEKEDSASCVYQTPPKRVNHLKLLCDSVDQLQDRLANIESHLQRLALGADQIQEQDTSISLDGSLSGSKERAGSCGDDASARREPSIEGSDQAEQEEETEVNRSYAGPFSLVALCERLRDCAVPSRGWPIADGRSRKLQALCETAAVTETLPACSDEPPVLLPPRQQVMAAVERFFQYGDCITDLFVPGHLLANLESVYAQPSVPDANIESWAICFKTITVLALGIEIATQHSNPTFFGDFARSLLPSRAALITPRLLTTPKLINVQVLILLSVAAQQFDPPGWAESIFAHACMLARMIGLHQTQLLAQNSTDVEAVERAKVLRSLYVRDRSLCTSRGAVSWLPSHDCDIVHQLNEGIEHRSPHAVRLQLAVIQDEVYLLNQTAYSCTSSSSKKLGASLQSIERQLERFAATFSIFSANADYSSPHSALIALEFLATRILALRHSSNPVHVERVRSDARASCLLLLMASGVRDQDTITRFHSLTGNSASSQAIDAARVERTAIPVASALDVFSIPSYFILNEGLIDGLSDDEKSASLNADRELLRKVSECYTRLTGWMQSNSYNLKVARVLSQVLDITDTLRHSRNGSRVSSPEDESMGSVSSSQRPAVPHAVDSSSELPDGSLSNLSDWPASSGSSSLTWDNWLSASSLMGPATPLGAVPGISDVSSPSEDLLTQLLTTPHTLSDGLDLPMYFRGLEPTGVSPRKRPRLDEQPPSLCLDGNALNTRLKSSPT